MTGLAFLTGGLLSATAGYIGMYVSTRANTRTAQAATKGIAGALNVAFRSGLTMGLTVASFGVLGLGLWTIFLVIGGEPSAARDRQRLRDGRFLDRAVRPCRRRHLHQGR